MVTVRHMVPISYTLLHISYTLLQLHIIEIQVIQERSYVVLSFHFKKRVRKSSYSLLETNRK